MRRFHIERGHIPTYSELRLFSPNHRNASYRRAIDAYRDELAKAAACPEPVPADLKKHLDNICQQMWAAIVYRNNDMMLKIKEISDKDKAELRAVRDKTLEENDTLRCQNDRLQEELYETKTALAEAQKTINSLKEQEIRLTSKLNAVTEDKAFLERLCGDKIEELIMKISARS